MIYLVKSVTGLILFPHHELKDLGNDKFILQRIKSTYEGFYNYDLGLIFHIVNKPGQKVLPSMLKVESQHCVASIKFDCFCFKGIHFIT